MVIRARFRRPIRHYIGPESVASIYDAWTDQRFLEHYWGGHLHVGYYGNPPQKKDFIKAKIDLIDEIVAWGFADQQDVILTRLENPARSSSNNPLRVLDVGCGIGRTVHYLASKWPAAAQVTGITISEAQVQRAVQLAASLQVDNAGFARSNALELAFAANQFDIVLALESEPHIPDKMAFLQELLRVLEPGGILILAAWNVRDSRQAPFSKSELVDIQFFLEEWNHAKFISINEYVELFDQVGFQRISAEDWSALILPSWREAVFEPFRRPKFMLSLMPGKFWNILRDGQYVYRMDQAYRSGLCRYGVIRGQKPALD